MTIETIQVKFSEQIIRTIKQIWINDEKEYDYDNNKQHNNRTGKK